MERPILTLKPTKQGAIIPVISGLPVSSFGVTANYDNLTFGAIAARISPGDSILVPIGFGYHLSEGFRLALRNHHQLIDKGLIAHSFVRDDSGEINVVIQNICKNQIWIKQGDHIAEFEIEAVLVADTVVIDGDFLQVDEPVKDNQEPVVQEEVKTPKAKKSPTKKSE